MILQKPAQAALDMMIDNSPVAQSFIKDDDPIYALIELEEIKLTIYLSAKNQRLFIDDHLETVDVSIKAPISGLLKLSKHKHISPSLLGEHKVRINGDLQKVERLFNIIKNLQVDWHGILSRYCGDLVAEQIMTHSRQANKDAVRGFNAAREQIRYIIDQPNSPIVNQGEAKLMKQKIQQLDQDVQGIEYRLSQLRQRINE